MVNIGSIFCFGNVRCTTPLMALCARKGIDITWLTEQGRFLASVQGMHRGNILLRQAQFRSAGSTEQAACLARSIVHGKISNFRTNLRRSAREARRLGHRDSSSVSLLEKASRRLSATLRTLGNCESVDSIRGIEGDASRVYFSAFDAMIFNRNPIFRFIKRSRRPPDNPINALLSFGYTLLAADVRSALEATGFDSRMGILHRPRPGRASLALDLMEELRPVWIDRLVLTLINRGQISPSGFRIQEAECGLPARGVLMDEVTRRVFITAYQKRKRKTILHPVTQEKMPLGLVPLAQSQLLAKYLRAESSQYTSYLWK